MGVICGWLGEYPGDQPAIIDNMLSAATGCAEIEPSYNVVKRAAAGVCDTHTSHSVYLSDKLCVAIEGHPYWTDANLTQLERSRGISYTIAEGFKQHGYKILERLYGDFALCILKPDDDYALLATDRVGIRPLAYTVNNGILLFGSHIASILSHPAVTTKIDYQGIFNYLYFHMIPSPETIFQNIYKLQPGEYIEFDNGTIRKQFYWQLKFSEEDNTSERELAIELRSQLDHSVITCLADKPIGTFLSGGLDSSTITGVFQSLSDKPVDAYGIGFDAMGFDEMEYARASARHFNASLHEYYVTPQNVLDAIPLITRAYDEPFGNASAIPAYFCADFAHRNGKELLLAGDGGDEIFAGNARYAKQKIFNLYQHVPSALKRALIEPLAFNFDPLRKLKSYIEQSKVPMPERLETYNFLHRTALNEIFDQDFLKQIDEDAPLNALRTHYDRAHDSHLVKKMLFLDHKFTLADNDLRKVNRMCELAGMDVRYPLLQDNMMSFAARIPADMLLKRFKLRSFYRQAMKNFLAKETLDKSKHGFGLPFGLWMEEYPPLREFAHNNLQQFGKRGILSAEYINRIITAQETGHASYYGVFLWVLIMLEQWLKCNNIIL